jgi:cobyrinic acid a,c-diamide synthase
MTGGLIIAAPRSGAGKTTVTLALIAALRRRGVAVRAAKTGPDYIDPAFHAAAAGHAGRNLDSWAMPPAALAATLADAAEGGELLVIEAAMGLFDGAGRTPGRSGAAADLAARFGLPVVLVLDVSGQSQSAGAVALGFARLRPAVRVAGVILNRVASARHAAGARQGLAEAGLAVLGELPREAGFGLPERHLGLVQAGEHADLPAYLDKLADAAEAGFDLAALRDLAMPIAATAADGPPIPPPGQRIALAQDAALSFVYPHLVAGWRRAGASVVPFSPLADEPPDPECDSCWLPGGYPELHAARLAEAARFRAGMRDFAAAGRPVHGECGGYMVLGEALEDAEGVRHPMLGLLGHRTSFRTRRLSLGYREATLLADGALGRRGAVLRGHEFHYATLTDPAGDPPLADLTDAAGAPLGAHGGRRERVSGSFFHAIATQTTGGDRP